MYKYICWAGRHIVTLLYYTIPFGGLEAPVLINFKHTHTQTPRVRFYSTQERENAKLTSTRAVPLGRQSSFSLEPKTIYACATAQHIQ